jgi:hypothetical protein
MKTFEEKSRLKTLSVLTIGIGIFNFSAFSASAHHSPRIFDTTSVLAFEGTITRVHWANLHTYYYT